MASQGRERGIDSPFDLRVILSSFAIFSQLCPLGWMRCNRIGFHWSIETTAPICWYLLTSKKSRLWDISALWLRCFGDQMPTGALLSTVEMRRWASWIRTMPICRVSSEMLTRRCCIIMGKAIDERWKRDIHDKIDVRKHGERGWCHAEREGVSEWGRKGRGKEWRGWKCNRIEQIRHSLETWQGRIYWRNASISFNRQFLPCACVDSPLTKFCK